MIFNMLSKPVYCRTKKIIEVNHFQIYVLMFNQWELYTFNDESKFLKAAITSETFPAFQFEFLLDFIMEVV